MQTSQTSQAVLPVDVCLPPHPSRAEGQRLLQSNGVTLLMTEALMSCQGPQHPSAMFVIPRLPLLLCPVNRLNPGPPSGVVGGVERWYRRAGLQCCLDRPLLQKDPAELQLREPQPALKFFLDCWGQPPGKSKLQVQGDRAGHTTGFSEESIPSSGVHALVSPAPTTTVHVSWTACQLSSNSTPPLCLCPPTRLYPAQ